MKINASLAVTSKSFSRHPDLRKMALMSFDRVVFCERDLRTSENLIAFLKEHNAAIVGLDQLSRDVIGALPKLKAISKYGVGLDNIDIDAVRERGIFLGCKPGVNARSVAELTLCFMLGMMRNVFRSGHHLKRMLWCKDGGCQLTGKTVGIVGCGNVGKDVVRLLSPFGCRVLVNDIVVYREFYTRVGCIPVGFRELLREADIVSLHVPLDDSTRHMMSDETLRFMKRTAYLVNTSRGAVVNTLDLKRVLKEGIIGGAALDVFEIEPPADNELLNMDNVAVTPHIGGNAEEAVLAMGSAAVNNLVDFFSIEGS